MPTTKEQAIEAERLFYERMKAEAEEARAKRLGKVVLPGRRTDRGAPPPQNGDTEPTS